WPRARRRGSHRAAPCCRCGWRGVRGTGGHSCGTADAGEGVAQVGVRPYAFTRVVSGAVGFQMVTRRLDQLGHGGAGDELALDEWHQGFRKAAGAHRMRAVNAANLLCQHIHGRAHAFALLPRRFGSSAPTSSSPYNVAMMFLNGARSRAKSMACDADNSLRAA